MATRLASISRADGAALDSGAWAVCRVASAPDGDLERWEPDPDDASDDDGAGALFRLEDSDDDGREALGGPPSADADRRRALRFLSDSCRAALDPHADARPASRPDATFHWPNIYAAARQAALRASIARLAIDLAPAVATSPQPS